MYRFLTHCYALHLSCDAILKWLIWSLRTSCFSSDSILSNSTSRANWPLEIAWKRNSGYFPGIWTFEQTQPLWHRKERTQAFLYSVLHMGLPDEKVTPELLSTQVGFLTRAEPHAPMALPFHRVCAHTAGEPAWPAEVPAAKSQPSLALQRSQPVISHTVISQLESLLEYCSFLSYMVLLTALWILWFVNISGPERPGVLNQLI